MALAYPVEKIEVDGDLSDWPRNQIRYPISKVLPILIAPAQEVSDIGAYFSAGYNCLAEQLVYLAVVVQDDSHVVGHNSHLDTDAVEVYIDGASVRNAYRSQARKSVRIGSTSTSPSFPSSSMWRFQGRGRCMASRGPRVLWSWPAM